MQTLTKEQIAQNLIDYIADDHSISKNQLKRKLEIEKNEWYEINIELAIKTCVEHLVSKNISVLAIHNLVKKECRSATSDYCVKAILEAFANETDED